MSLSSHAVEASPQPTAANHAKDMSSAAREGARRPSAPARGTKVGPGEKNRARHIDRTGTGSGAPAAAYSAAPSAPSGPAPGPGAPAA